MLAPRPLILLTTERKEKNGMGTGNQGQRICTAERRTLSTISIVDYGQQVPCRKENLIGRAYRKIAA